MSQKLDALLKQLHKLHPKYIDLSLDRLRKLLEKLNNPHLKLPPVIHIAGTNGKGSTLSFIQNILIENNYSIHAYISPHLKSFNERIIIRNKLINKKSLYSLLKKIKKINNNEPITFFEITTAAAFYIFSKKKSDFLILETGLGGRLDATNIINKSLIDIITPIGIDHQDFLGKSLKKITNEKLGIIKKGSTIIISKQKKLVKNHILNKLNLKKNNTLFYGNKFKILEKNSKTFKLEYNKKKYIFNNPKLIGEHQIENASTAITSIFILKNLGYNFNNKSINKGIINTVWPGRLEKVKLDKIPVYLDGAHNIDGAKKLLNFFNQKKQKVWIIIGMLNNKNLNDFVKILQPITQGIVAVTIPKEKNSFTSDEIFNVCKTLNIICYKKTTIKLANQFLKKTIKPKLILVTGSLYLIGSIRDTNYK